MSDRGWNPHGPRLLLADEDRALCSVLGRALEIRGFSVTAVHDYHAALRAACGAPPQFAVLELKLPGGSGLHVLKQLLAMDRSMRIVVLTRYPSIATAVAATKAGAQHYLAKPASRGDILSALEGHVAPPAEHVFGTPLSMRRLKWERLQRALTAADGNISATARLLGVDRRTLQRKLNKHPIHGSGGMRMTGPGV